MPIIITWESGERQAFEGPEATKALEYRYIPVKRFDNGHEEWLVKDKARSIENFPAEDWNKMVEEGKKKHEAEEKRKAEDQAKDQADAEAKRKADADAATLALLESKTIKGRIKKLLGRG